MTVARAAGVALMAAGCTHRAAPVGPVVPAAPPAVVAFDCPPWDPATAPRPVAVSDRRRVLADRRATEAEELIAEAAAAPADQAMARLIDAFFDLEASLRLDPYSAHATFVLAYGYRAIDRPRCTANLLERLDALGRHPRFAATVVALASGPHYAAWSAELARPGPGGSASGDGCVIARDGVDPAIDPDHPEPPEIGCVRPLPRLPP